MIDRKTVFDIYQLKDAGYSARLIAREMRLGRDSVSKYLKNPDGALQARKPRASKLDAYRDLIDALLEEYPFIGAPVVL
jgi:transposase